MDNSTQNIQKGRALAGFGKVFSGIGVVILVAGVILSATPAIAAGVIIAVAGTAGISPMAVVRRTWIPMIAGMFTTIIAKRSSMAGICSIS